MAGRITKCFIGIQDDGKDTYRRDTVLTRIWKRGSHPGQNGTHKLQSGKL